MGTKGKQYGSVCNAKPRVLRQKRRDNPSSSIARAATAGCRCRWHRRSRRYSRNSGETARRAQCSNRKANMACKTALGRLDLSDLLRRESESAAETAENDSCKSQAALHASEAALRAAEAALRALDFLRRSSDRSSFPIAVFRAILAFVCSSSMLSSRCRTALLRIASSTAIPPAGSAPGMGCCSPSPSMSAAAAAAAAACLLLLLLLVVARRGLLLLSRCF